MSDFIYLTGSEDVLNAAHEMTRAAETMRRAAGEMDEIHIRFIRGFRDAVEYMNTEDTDEVTEDVDG